MQMPTQNSRIKVDLNLLRDNPTSKAIIRFSDLSDRLKTTFALRIKETSTVYKLRRYPDDSPKIFDALKDIDPIIFSENIAHTYYNRESHQNFNIFNVHSIQGYNFKKLCSAIYHLICLRRPLRKKEMEIMAFLTCGDWRRAQEFMERNFINHEPAPVEDLMMVRREPMQEFGLEEMERVRRATEERTRYEARNNNPYPTYQDHALVYQTTDIPGFDQQVTYESTPHGIAGASRLYGVSNPMSGEEENLLTGELDNESLSNNQ